MPEVLKPIGENDLKTQPVIRAQGPGQVYGRILVATDFTAASTPALEQGLKLARQNHAELLIVHSSVTPASLSFMNADSYEEWEKQCRTDAETNIGALIQEARKEGIKAHMLELLGLADDAIVEAAERLEVDLIVLGTHGRRGVSRFFLGSVAAQVVARARCPVLTVRSWHRERKFAHPR
ncbi:MAG: universal stress protein [Verrucomicrobiota bacterium]|jgi:nucleotide-binding universal stress UspA family protein